MNYYNTTNESGELLADYEQVSAEQERIILRFFKQHWHCAMSPSYVWNLHQEWPLTSVRRTITDLTKAGHLVKTDVKVKGLYGRDEYTWQYREKSS